MDKDNFILINHISKYFNVIVVDDKDYYITTKFHDINDAVEMLPLNTNMNIEHDVLSVLLKEFINNRKMKVISSGKFRDKELAKEIIKAKKHKSKTEIVMETIEIAKNAKSADIAVIQDNYFYYVKIYDGGIIRGSYSLFGEKNLTAPMPIHLIKIGHFLYDRHKECGMHE